VHVHTGIKNSSIFTVRFNLLPTQISIEFIGHGGPIFPKSPRTGALTEAKGDAPREPPLL